MWTKLPLRNSMAMTVCITRETLGHFEEMVAGNWGETVKLTLLVRSSRVCKGQVIEYGTEDSHVWFFLMFISDCLAQLILLEEGSFLFFPPHFIL